MDQSWQFWVRRVDSLGKTKNRLAAGQWFREAAAGEQAMAPPAGAQAQKQPEAHAHELSPYTCTTSAKFVPAPSSGPPHLLWYFG